METASSTTNEAAQPFGDWLRDKMYEYHFNQPKLAELLRVNQSTISNWIRGKVLPDTQKVTVLAKLFQTDRVVLLEMLGIEVGQSYEFQVLGPIVEKIDQMLAKVDDPEDRTLIEERLKNDVRAAEEMLEALNQRRHRKDEE